MTISAERIDAAIERARQLREQQTPEERGVYLQKLEQLPPDHPWLQPETEDVSKPAQRKRSKK